MSSRATQSRSMSEQLESIKGLVVSEVSSETPTSHDNVTPFPVLFSVEELEVPQDMPTPASAKPSDTLKSNMDYWLEFEQKVNEFPVAKTLVDFLDQNPEMRIQLNGLYLQACITIKRDQVKFAQDRSAVEQSEKQAAEHAAKSAADALHEREQTYRDAELRLEREALMSSPLYWLGRLVGSIKIWPKTNVPGFVSLAAIAALCLK